MLVRPTRSVRRFVSPGDTVADLGAGPGFYTLPLAAIVGSEGKVHAVDPEEASIRKLEAKLASRNAGPIETHVASAAALDRIPDDSLDFIWANLVLCCMVDHDGAVAEIKRTMKSEGSAYLSVARNIRRKDPRDVKGPEWRSILEGFRVLKKGGRLTYRWALVCRKTS